MGRLQGAEGAWVAVDADNHIAQSLYRKTGAMGVPVFTFSYGPDEAETGSGEDSPSGFNPG